MLKVYWGEVGSVNTLGGVLNSGLKVALNVLHEMRLGFARVRKLDPVRLTWNLQQVKHGHCLTVFR